MHKVVTSPNRVTHILFLLACALLISNNAVSADSIVNFLADYNPGFEDAGSGIPKWDSSDGIPMHVTTDTCHSGSKSIVCDTVSGWHMLVSNCSIPVEPGYVYKMGVWGKYSNFTFTNMYGMGYGLLQKRSDGTLNGNWYDMMAYLDYPSQPNASRDWFYTEMTLPVVPKDTTTSLTPVLKVESSSGQVWFDDIVVWKEPKPDNSVVAYLNIIENGSFEIFMNDGKPNGFSVKAPDGMLDTYNSRYTCVQDVKYDRTTSLKMTGECVLVSNMGYCSTNQGSASIEIKTAGVTGDGAYARLVVYNESMSVIGTYNVASLTGTADWQKFSYDLSGIGLTARYVQWEFGMKPGSSGTAYFDDLQVNVPTTYSAMPIRTRDTSNANVNVDCTIRGSAFESPLNSYDTGGIQFSYSPTLFTAGSYVEDAGRWYAKRSSMGFKYVRLHDLYAMGCWSMSNDGMNHWILHTNTGREQYPDSRDGFGAYYSIDSSGVAHCDFSQTKRVLDKVVLAQGCKPIIGLGPVPRPIAKYLDEHNIPGTTDDWNKWEDLNYQFVKFLVDTYGADEVCTWIFETGNEPSTAATFHGDPDNPSNIMNDFFKLQDYSIHGARRALPDICITGPSGPPEGWFDPMLTHCATGTNYFTGQIGTQIDGISYHGYLGGSPTDLSWRQSEDQVLRCLGYIDRYYQKTGKRLKLLNTEASPMFFDGASDLSNISDEYNNHIQAIATMHMGCFSHRLGVSLISFYREAPMHMVYYNGVSMADIPEFTGISTLITSHGIFTPTCRAYEMMSKLNGGNEVTATADKEPIYAIATATDSQIKILCYSYDVNPKASYTTSVNVTLNPASVGSVFNATRYVLSSTASNSWYIAKQRNLKQADCGKDISIVDQINTASGLQPENIGTLTASNGRITFNVSMPAFSAVLYVLDKVN